jgi:hypothetical protein
MVYEAWPARVFDLDSQAGGGAGLLIDHRQVLTCAHVVDGMRHPAVRFPARPDLGDIPAHARIMPGWRGCDPYTADVALLQLAHPVSLEPAHFASLDTVLGEFDSLIVLGFPDNPDGKGRIARVNAISSTFPIDGEWIQLNATVSCGPVVRKGYSGSAVTLRGTSEVVGMITAADPGEHLSHMLPLTSLVRHCDDLIDVIPLGPIRPSAHRKLRSLLLGMPLANANHAYRVAVQNELLPPLRNDSSSPSPPDAYAVARHIVGGSFLDDPNGATVRRALGRLCYYLAEETISQATGDALRQWANQYALVEKAPVTVAWPTGDFRLVVRIARSGADSQTMLLNLSVRPPSGFTSQVYQGRSSVVGLRGVVEDLLPKVISDHVPLDAGVIIEFVLPRPWLSKPVDEWRMGRGSTVQMGWRHPVVVRDMASSEPGIDQREMQRRWTNLHAVAPREDVVFWVRCGNQPHERELAARLTAEIRCAVLALANPPTLPSGRAALRAGFDTGIPVMLWCRRRCSDHDGARETSDCKGRRFEEALSSELGRFLNTCPGSELPKLIHRLRSAAAQTADNQRHCGRELTLVWNVPDPPTPAPVLI